MTVVEHIQCAEAQDRLIKYFENKSCEERNSVWIHLWETDNSDLWDRRIPSPALIDLIEGKRAIFNPYGADGQRKKVLVPGCGKGYDVVMLALHGFDVFGLDISAKGLQVAREYATQELHQPHNYNFGSAMDLEKLPEPGEAKFILGDFFQSDWEAEVGGKFDLIYDYTFLCALYPTMRRPWADRMADLLRRHGQLVCLEYPLWKDPSLPGPPWGLKGVYWDLLARGGDGIVHILDGVKHKGQETENGRFTRAMYERPARSYMMGKGVDMLSVYVRK